MEIISLELELYLVDPLKEIEVGSLCVYENMFIEKIEEIGNGYMLSSGGVRNPINKNLKVIVACTKHLKRRKGIPQLDDKVVSDLFVKWAVNRLTKYKREYAPDAHAINEEITKMLKENNVFPLASGEIMRFQSI